MQGEVAISNEVILAEQAETCSLHVIDWLLNLVRILLLTLLENIGLKTKLIDLRDRCKELEAENQELYERLHLDCDTSSIPPSKDWKKNSVPKESEEAAEPDSGQVDKETPISITDYLKDKANGKRRPGGQKNHPPAFMHIDGAREGEPILHYPKRCANCPNFGRCAEEGRFRVFSTAYGYDIEVIRVSRKHVLFEATECMNDESLIHDDFPEVIGSQFYDTNVQLHVIVWHHIFHGSYDRIDLAAKELFGLSLSAGTANAIVMRASSKIFSSGFMDALRFFALLFEKVLGVDETSARVGGRNAWVHTSVTANVTLLIAHWRRGYEGTVYAGVLQFYINTFISDCWASYFNETFKCRHAICNGHILRELVAAAYFRKQNWAIEMFDLLLEIFEAKKDAIEQGEKSLSQDYIDDIRISYQKIVTDGFNENAGVTKGKTFSLLERLKKLENATLAFAMDFSVDFTNNASELSLRDLKVALRVIGQFKTISGLTDYCAMQSFMDTCRKQGKNPFDMLRIVLSGGDIIDAVFGSEKAEQIKQMIRLADAFDTGDTNEINTTIAGTSLLLTEELLAAASYGRLKPYNDPPPPEKNSSPAIPKDKMLAAREFNAPKVKKPKKSRIRGEPKCA